MDKLHKYTEIIKTLFAGSHEKAGGQEFRYFHCVNVANICKLLAEEIKLSAEDKETVMLAAIFHDVAKSKNIEDDGFLDGSQEKTLNHEEEGALMVADLVRDDFSAERIKQIQAVITNHKEPKELLEKVLHDADELSEMGVMNLWKMFTFAAYKNRGMNISIDYWQSTDKARHLEKMNDLCLEESKKEAQKRIDITDEIVEKLNQEIASA